MRISKCNLLIYHPKRDILHTKKKGHTIERYSLDLPPPGIPVTTKNDIPGYPNPNLLTTGILGGGFGGEFQATVSSYVFGEVERCQVSAIAVVCRKLPLLGVFRTLSQSCDGATHDDWDFDLSSRSDCGRQQTMVNIGNHVYINTNIYV